MIPPGGTGEHQGLESARVRILSVGGDGRCLVRDTLGREREVLYSLRPKGVGRPAPEETWVIQRLAGDTWVLGQMVGAPEPATVTGSWVDQDTAGPALLATLADLGLLVDGTTGGGGGTPLPTLLADLDDRISVLEAQSAGTLSRVGYASSPSSTVTGIAATETFLSFLYAPAYLTAGRTYWALAYLRLTVTTNTAAWCARIRHSGSSSNPTASNEVVGSYDGNHQLVGGGGQQTPLVGGSITAAADGTSVFGASLQRVTGSGTINSNPPTDGSQWLMVVEVR